MTEKEVQADFEERRRELFAKMSKEDLQFLSDVDDWEKSAMVYNLFDRYGGLWFLGYIKAQLKPKNR